MSYGKEYHCPNCGSHYLTVTTRGFDVAQAIMGRALVRKNAGLIAGAYGSQKPKLVCVECGYSFYAWNYYKEIERCRRRRERRAAMRVPKYRQLVYMTTFASAFVTNIVLYLIFKSLLFLCFGIASGFFLLLFAIYKVAFASNPIEEQNGQQALPGEKKKQPLRQGKKQKQPLQQGKGK